MFPRIERISLIKGLIFAVYALMIFEGALRKWILPELSSALFFVKDPLVILVYFHALRGRLISMDFAMKTFALTAYAFLLLAILQFTLNQLNPLITMIGFRNYFFLVPLSYIIYKVFDVSDLKQLARITCLIGIPAALLVYIQSISPVDSFINKNVGVNENTRIFEVVKGVVRTSGFFSFTNGHAIFTTSLFTCLIYNAFLPAREKFLSRPLFILCFLCGLVCVAVSGSRGLIADLLILGVFVAGPVLLYANLRQKIRIISLGLGLMIIGGGLAMTLLSQHVENIMKRFEQASKNEDTAYRLASQYIELYDHHTATGLPLWGAGLGLGSGAGSFLHTGNRGLTLSEDDWPRIIDESGPVFGTIYILLRVGLAFLLFYLALKVQVETGSIVPLIFVGFTFMSILSAQITKQGTEFYYCWFFVGVCFAAVKSYSKPVQVVD